jgi:phenylalanyl-tRNA synthetase beta chain
VVSEQVEHDALMATLRADEAGLVRRANLFDIYKPSAPTADIPAGHRSLAVRLELLDDTATLTEERIDAAVALAVARAQAAHGARLRA